MWDGWKDDNRLQLREKTKGFSREKGNAASECGKRFLSHRATASGAHAEGQDIPVRFFGC